MQVITISLESVLIFVSVVASVLIVGYCIDTFIMDVKAKRKAGRTKQ